AQVGATDAGGGATEAVGGAFVLDAVAADRDGGCGLGDGDLSGAAVGRMIDVAREAGRRPVVAGVGRGRRRGGVIRPIDADVADRQGTARTSAGPAGGGAVLLAVVGRADAVGPAYRHRRADLVDGHQGISAGGVVVGVAVEGPVHWAARPVG